MKSYKITIKATVIKTMMVEAKDEVAAEEIAHGDFSVLCDEDKEKYEQETLKVKEVI